MLGCMHVNSYSCVYVVCSVACTSVQYKVLLEDMYHVFYFVLLFAFVHSRHIIFSGKGVLVMYSTSLHLLNIPVLFMYYVL